MAIGGNIKVTLTLDDAGFTVKSQQAAKGVNTLNKEIKSFGGGLTKAESSVKNLGERVKVVSRDFTTLATNARDSAKHLDRLSTSGAKLDSTTKALVGSFTQLQGMITQFSQRLGMVNAGMGQATTGATKLSGANKELARSTTAVADGMTRQERAARNLGTATEQTTAQIRLSAVVAKDAASQAMAAEFHKNAEIIANKRQAYASMLRAEQQYQRQLEAAKSKAMATQMRIENRKDSNGRFVGANSEFIRGLQQQLQLELKQVQALEQSVNLISQEAVKMQSTINTTQKRNAELKTGLGLREQEVIAVNRQAEAAAQAEARRLAAQRAARQQMIDQNNTLREQMGLVKSLAQMWGAMKIYQGEKASVNEAGTYQTNLMRAKAMGLTPEQMNRFEQDTKTDSKANRGVSYNDAAEARLATMGGLATTNRDIVNSILPELIEGAKNVQFLEGDESKEGFRDLVRNLSGFIEARQQQYDPAAAKGSIDLVTQINAATGGKINLQDLETILRRMGAGANQVSDNGIRNIVALMDQAKVAGGGSGGGAGGVSTVGTMIKMLQAYGNGKTKTNQAVQALVEAGVLDTSQVDPNKAFGQQMKFLKNAGFKDQKELNTDPVGAFIKIAEAAFKSMTSNKQQIKKYFGSEDADINDPEMRRSAMTKWATRQGYTTTATSMFVTAADPRFQERMHHQNEMIQGSEKNSQVTQDRNKSYQGNVDAFNASLNNLKITLGTSVLPLVTKFFNGINQLITAANEFGQKNPLASQLTMIGGAFLSAVLALKGFSSMLGIVVKAGTSFGIFGGQAANAAAAAGSVGKAAGSILNPLTVARGSLAGVAGAAKEWGASMVGANSRLMNSSTKVLPLIGSQFRFLGTAIGASFRFIGKAFLRAIPFVGWLITAWDLGGLLWNFEVGGAKIGEWITNWCQDLWSTVKVAWEKIKGIFNSDDAEDKATEAAISRIRAEAKARGKAFDDKIAAAKKAKEADDAAKKANKEAAEGSLSGSAMGHFPGAKGDGKGGAGGKKEDDGFTPVDPGSIDWSDGKTQRGFENPFTSSLAEMRRKAMIDAQQAGAAIADTGNDLVSEARTAFEQKWIAGDFDPGHDPNKRQFKGKDGKIDWNATSANGEGPQQWIDQYVAMKKAEDQLKSMEFVKQRSVAAEQDYGAAMQRTTGETGKANRDLLALQRELARAGERLKDGTADWAAWAAEKNRALETKAGATIVNFTADFADGDRKAQADLMPDGYAKQTAEMDAAILKDKENYESLKQFHLQAYNDEMAAYKEMLATNEINNEQYTQKATAATKRYTDAATKAETAYTQHVAVQNLQRQRAAESSTDKLAREWQNTYAAIETMQANWSNSFVDNLATMLSGGRANWKDFLRGMAADILNAKIKESFGGVITGMFGSIGNLLKGTLMSNASTAGASGAAGGLFSSIGSGISSMASTVGGWFGGGSGTAATGAAAGSAGAAAGAAGAGGAAAAANTQLASAANTATEGLQNMSQTGIMGAITSIGQWIVSLFTGTTASTVKATSDTAAATATMTLSSAMIEAALAATNMSIAMTAAATTSTATAAFANGGIMTSGGSVPLKKYAKGGIATTPQLALYGEGRHPEAYVPLPDGRTIPVTMTGDSQVTQSAGQSNAVMISIEVNNQGGDTTQTSNASGDASQKGQWAAAAEKMKAIALEVITEQKRPNGLLQNT